MDRVFLDANVLFSVACGEESGLLRLWGRRNVEVCTSAYAVEEAKRNLPHDDQRGRLAALLRQTRVLPESPPSSDLPPDVRLVEKDAPILLAAIHGGATHLLTGDIRHFGSLLGRQIAGVWVLRPATYLRRSVRP